MKSRREEKNRFARGLTAAAAAAGQTETSFGAVMARCADHRKLSEVVRRHAAAAGGLLSRIFAAVHGRVAHKANRRMRVAEVVSLGEKRFVALLSIDGQDFLIGGGSTGVSLLATMDREGQPAHTTAEESFR